MCLQVIAERLSEEEIAGLRQLFKAVDVKNRGVITLGELREGLRRYGTELEDREFSDIVEAVSNCLVAKTCICVTCVMCDGRYFLV
jgi:calcium-dependent protein kinase